MQAEVRLTEPHPPADSFFNMVATISGAFVQATAADVDEVINSALAAIGRFYQADRCYLFKFSADLTTASNSHEWCAPGVSPQLEQLQQLPSAAFGEWYRQWTAGFPSILHDINSLPHDSAEYQLLAPQGIQSLLMLPLKSRDRLLGMFGLDIVRNLQQWSAEQIAGLQLIAGNICSALIRQQIEHQAESLAFYDPVTGLANRQLMLDRILQAQLQSSRSQHYAALLFIDIDDFKTLNDSLGYNTGDRVLKLVGQSLQAVLPSGDTVGRLNADEFLILTEMLSTQRAAAVQEVTDLAAALQAAVAQNAALTQLRPKNTLSIGATLFLGDQLDTDVLITQADMAMHQVKAVGNGLAFFDAEMQLQASRRLLLAHELREAISNDQFELYFQPQLVHPGVVTGAEALLRWRHPTRGILGPYEFIDFAEESGLILPIGELVLRKACQQLALWQRQAGTSRLELSVNISARQFQQPDFTALVIEILQQSGVDAKSLKLELTESMLVDNFEQVVAKMQQLRALGIRFALDDFGTGYSSLVYLKRLPLYQLKIDRGFVDELVQDDNQQAIVRTIIMLGQTLGLEVLAEGVETEAQLKSLLQLGCYHYQGYYFARPLPHSEFEHFLRQHHADLGY
ncbi:MAG: putative bifunctional diguanylate cyclase/phosphodiesterase [Alishewanella aestuarii]